MKPYYVIERHGMVYTLGFESPYTVDDLPGIGEVAPGSAAYNSDTGAVYWLQANGTWREQ